MMIAAQVNDELLLDPERFRPVDADIAIEPDEPGSLASIDLNRTELEDLQSHPLIGPVLALAVVAHRNRFGDLLGPEELLVVEGFDSACIRRLRPLLRFGVPLIDQRFRLQSLLHESAHELLLRQRISSDHDVGYGNDGNYPFYQGDAQYLMMRYRLRAGRHFSVGILAEKDPGEQMISRKGGRMDFFSWSVMLRPERFVKSICIGDFQVQFGQGLVMWSGVSLGKGNEVTGISRRGVGVRSYNSPGESGFQRGLAVSFSHGAWTLDTWCSYQKLDASFVPLDTTYTQFAVSSFQESGLHRNADELARKANLGSWSTGLHLMHERTRLVQEFTLGMIHYDQTLWPGDDPYERFDASGRMVSAVAYTLRLRLNNGIAFTEFATDAKGHPAWLSGLVLMPDRRWTLSAHLRDYNRAYQAPAADAFREGSRTRNEQGLYLGARYQVHRTVYLQAWYDRFHFPWLRYTQSEPVWGREWQMQLVHSPSRNTELQLRYRVEEKPVDGDQGVFRMPYAVLRRSLRFDLSWMQGKDWAFQSRVEGNRIVDAAHVAQGLLLFHEFRYKPLGKPFSLVLRYTVFRTDDYASRVYTYQQDMAGVFSLPAFSGRGQHAYLLCRVRLRQGIDLWLRCGRTLSGGLAETDLKSQLRWQF
ncbi:MAG: helix-hairpin-helix domain-containing protein [Bacteroidota bacterium]